MKRKYARKHPQEREIAKERIEKLFEQAHIRFSSDRTLANRYVQLARTIAMKYKVRMPPVFKRQFCKHCYHYLMPSVNCRVRLGKSRVIYYCLECKKFMRILLKARKKLRKPLPNGSQKPSKKARL